MSFKKIKEQRLYIISRLLFIVSILILSIFGFIIYQTETQTELKGTADYQITYKYNLSNLGPLNISSVSIRLALLKDWDPVQKVTNLDMLTEPNKTTTDEYSNLFAWYDYDTLLVGQSLDLEFKVNLTLNLLDFTTKQLDFQPYNNQTTEFKLFTSFDPLVDEFDPAIQQTSSLLKEGADNDILRYIYNAYNFTSTYLNYKLLTTARGASFALANGYGDCDEYTNLLIALLRANGIPAIAHTAWLADFLPGFETSDQGSAAHSYPMVWIEGIGLLPLDPTRGNKNLFDNYLKTDEKRITLTRGPDHPYRLLRYRFTPLENLPDPTIISNYTIRIDSMNVQYSSILRTAILGGLILIPISFIGTRLVYANKDKQMKEEKLQKIISPYK